MTSQTDFLNDVSFSASAGPISLHIAEILKASQADLARTSGQRFLPSRSDEQPLSVTLFNSRAEFKRRISSVAMHLNEEWRNGLFAQIDSLLDEGEWDPDDRPVVDQSYQTAIRLLIFLRPERRPGLAASSEGNLVLSWTSGQDRLTILCGSDDRVRWIINRKTDGVSETAAGCTSAYRAKDVLAPYGPGDFFQYGNSKNS